MKVFVPPIVFSLSASKIRLVPSYHVKLQQLFRLANMMTLLALKGSFTIMDLRMVTQCFLVVCPIFTLSA